MFNWLSNLFSTRSGVTLQGSESDLIALLGGRESESGVRVNPKTILQNPAVWRGVNLISSQIAKVPLVVYRRRDGSREVARNHPAFQLLQRSPSDYTTPVTWKQATLHDALIYGNSFHYIERDATGKPISLLWLDPSQTTAKKERGRIVYVTQIEQTQFVFGPADVLHIKGLSADGGLEGLALCDVLKDALGLGLALQSYGSYFFKNLARPSLVIELPANVKDVTKIAEFKQRWNENNQGLKSQNRAEFVLPGTKVQPIGMQNNEGQWVEAREHDLVMVADILGIPPSKLGSRNQISYASLESDNKNFLSDSLDSWLVKLEEELSLKLLSERQLFTDSHYIEANRKALIQIDAKTEVELLTMQLANNVLAWEEVRGILNLPDSKEGLTFIGTTTSNPSQPEPQAEPPQATLAPGVANEEANQEAAQRLSKLANGVVHRLVTRVAKSVDAKAKKGELTDYIEQLASDHRSVAVEQLAAFDNAAVVVDDWLAELREELQATSQADLPKVLQWQEANIPKLVMQLGA